MIVATVIEKAGEFGKEVFFLFDDKLEHLVAWLATLEATYHGHHIATGYMMKRRQEKKKQRDEEQCNGDG